MITQLLPYVPSASISHLEFIIKKQDFLLKIVKPRKTKRGDFKATYPIPTISINNNLSKEQFLVTLVHEIAHLHTFLTYPKAKPHGQEWKYCFQQLMLPLLNPNVFNENLLKLLANHFKNPKATTDADPKLSVLLQPKNIEATSHNYYIFDLAPNTIFTLNNRTFKIVAKKRTRYECVEIDTKKRYLIRGNASVKVL